MTSGISLYRFPAWMDGLPDFSISVYADRLAALFLMLTGGLSIAAVLHMVDGLEAVLDRNRIVAAYNFFVFAIVFTILANGVYLFLFALECITLSYAYLVLFQHNQNIADENTPAETMKAAKTAFQTYLIFEHAGSIFLLIALMLISLQSPGAGLSTSGCAPELHGGMPEPLGFDFDAFRCANWQGGGVRGPAANLIFLLALVGFGIKAGVFPTHIWVSLVHPFSPSSFPALMSGIGLAVSGLYGMYRVFFEFTGPGEIWWGLLVLLLAGASALVGAFYGMLGRDLKTALASYSVAHVGIILTGIGLAMIFRSAERYAAAAATFPGLDFVQAQAALVTITRSFRLGMVLALIASLYHLVNHAVFKSLLYFASGAIENRTGTTALDRLGGLIKRYPWTSAAFLVGALAISGLPPFNGFVSQWLTLQAVFSGMNLFLPGIGPRLYVLAGLTLALLCLALSFGITALSFVKIAGEVLLGAPRDAEVARRSKPGEVSWWIRSALVVLALLSLIMGLMPAVTAHGLSQVARDFSAVPQDDPLPMSAFNLAIHIPVFQLHSVKASEGSQEKLTEVQSGYQTRLSVRMLWALAGILASPFLLTMVRRFSKRGRDFHLRRGPVWTGGAPYRPEVMQVTSSAFSSQVWTAFEARKKSQVARGEETETIAGPVFPIVEQLTEQRAVPDVFRFLYDYATRCLVRVAERFGDWAQPGDIRQYLLYIFIVFVLVLVIYLRLSRTGGM